MQAQYLDYVQPSASLNHDEQFDTNQPLVDEEGNYIRVPDTLRNLLDETADFIESPNAGEVIKRLVHTGLSVSVSKISALYPVPPVSFEEVVTTTIEVDENNTLDNRRRKGRQGVTTDPRITEITEEITSSQVIITKEDKNGSVINDNSNSNNSNRTNNETLNQSQNIPEPTVKLASILANISRQAHSISSGNPLEPNEYIDAMTNVPDLNSFSAVVYSNFDWRVLDNNNNSNL